MIPNLRKIPSFEEGWPKAGEVCPFLCKAPQTEHIATYLNDHLAGANFAIDLLERLILETGDSTSPLRAIKVEISEDREKLRTIMARMNISESRVRKTSSWLAKNLTEIKLVIDDDPGGPLRHLERLEALSIGIEGKVALWLALDAAAPDNRDLGGENYGGLIQRAINQRVQVERLRLESAREALAS